MAKQDEIDYLKNIGTDGAWHALEKPFSDTNCGLYLTDMGILMSLLPKPPAKVLDLGVGSGWTSVFLARRGHEVIGQDIAPDMIDLANINKKRNGIDNLHFIVSDYESLNYKEEFDAAIFYDCLHHCEDQESALKSAYNALKPSGILITVEPGKGHSKAEISKEVMRKFGVTEKNMPPKLIINVGKKIGFRGAKIFLRHIEPEELTLSKQQYMRLLKTFVLRNFRSFYLNRSNFVVLTK